MRTVPELDTDLELSERLDPDAVPAVSCSTGAMSRVAWRGLSASVCSRVAAGRERRSSSTGCPDRARVCASVTRDPAVAARLAARRARADGRIRSRELSIGELEDPFEALFDRGYTDGLPLVPPTPERVVAMLDAHLARPAGPRRGASRPTTASDGREGGDQRRHGRLPRPSSFPIVLAAVEAACDPAFALHGLLSTTHPAGPVIVVVGPYAAQTGMNSGGQRPRPGQPRAALTIGRALQLVVRNVGGGKPRGEDRAAHGQPGKLGFCFAERLDGLAVARARARPRRAARRARPG